MPYIFEYLDSGLKFTYSLLSLVLLDRRSFVFVFVTTFEVLATEPVGPGNAETAASASLHPLSKLETCDC